MFKKDLYAVMGSPIEHSLSPQIHQAFAKQCKARINYEKLLVNPDSFSEAIKEFLANGGLGLNITVPLKQIAFDWVDKKTKRAAMAGAVNTIKFYENGNVLGDNTDGVGLVNDLKNHKVEILDKRILLIGAGGAARGVILPLLQEQPSELVIANRTVERANDLSIEFGEHGNVSAKAFFQVTEPFDIVINATSSSMNNTIPDISIHIFEPQTIAYDMFYAKKHTSFQNFARDQKVKKVFDGLGMLVEQAAESFYVWRGFRPETKEVLKAIRSII